MILKNSNPPNPTHEPLSEITNPTWSSFVMWFHKLYDRNWDENSYTKISKIDSVNHFWGTYNNLLYKLM